MKTFCLFFCPCFFTGLKKQARQMAEQALQKNEERIILTQTTTNGILRVFCFSFEGGTVRIDKKSEFNDLATFLKQKLLDSEGFLDYFMHQADFDQELADLILCAFETLMEKNQKQDKFYNYSINEKHQYNFEIPEEAEISRFIDILIGKFWEVLRNINHFQFDRRMTIVEAQEKLVIATERTRLLTSTSYPENLGTSTPVIGRARYVTF